MKRCGKLAAEEIQTIIEVAHARLPHRTSRPRAAEPIRRSCRCELHHPHRQNLVAHGSLSRVWNAIRRVHSRYTRTLADLPWQGIPVTVRLHVRRFFCGKRTCPRTIFAERLSASSGTTLADQRLDGWFTHISFALGGEAGSRLLKELGIVVSADTLLNHIRSTHLRDHETPKVLSVDDFSFRRGHKWGTILVDLEHNRAVDLLPDRSSDAFAAWLSRHPGVEVISRDRGGEYADAARKAAPSAIQVADRFHLIKNLGDVVLRVFQRRSESLKSIPAPGPNHLELTRLRLDREASCEHTKAQMNNLFRSIQALRWAGMNKSAIARTLGVHRHTVQRYAALERAPERKPRVRKASALAPYEDYILKRFADGCHNATQIHKEISEQGYPGSYKNVWRIIQYLKKCERDGEPARRATRSLRLPGERDPHPASGETY